MPNLFTLTLQLAVVLAVCRLVGELFRLMHQPKVVGEMFAGIMLGPSLLGWIAPHASAYLFPPSSLGFLNALSQVGVVIFMFLVGLGINPGELKKEGHAAVLDQPCEYYGAVCVGRVSGLVFVSAALGRQRFIHQLCPVHGRGHEHYGFPGSGPDS